LPRRPNACFYFKKTTECYFPGVATLLDGSYRIEGEIYLYHLEKHVKKLLAVVLFGLTFANPVFADVVGSGSGFNIPDASAGGASSTVTFTENELITGNVVVTLTGLTHTWVGDVTATLIAPDSTSHNLFFRIGRVGSGFGDSSDFGGTYIFGDSATNDIWAEAAARLGNEAITPASYRTTSSDSASFTSIDSAFSGLSTQGTWTLFMSDLEGGDVGSLGSWTLSMSAVPEPNSLALLALAGLTFVAKLRRR
jgi:subtilisin-like proprotein convertase family protein